MNSHRTILTVTVSLAATVLALAGRAGADPISYDQAPLSNVVAHLNQQYGINIVLKGGLTQNPGRPVTLSLGDATTTPTRLQVINALANAAGVDFQKGYVVSKMAADDVPPPVKIDTNGYVIFQSTTVPARDAIAAVATTDGATIQIGSDVTGDVTLPKTTMRAADAAAEIARQTHTRWRVYYALTPHGMAQRGKVVDHNNGGQAIVELPFTYYGSQSPPEEKVADNGTDNAGATTQTNTNSPTGSATNALPYSYAPALAYPTTPYYTYGTGYGMTPFGTPYPTQYGGFGYGGYSGNGVNILPGYGGYGPYGGYGGMPITF